MAGKKVVDPAVLEQLNAAGRKPVSDPALLSALNSEIKLQPGETATQHGPDKLVVRKDVPPDQEGGYMQAAGAGLRSLGEGMGGLPGDINSLASHGAGWLAKKMGADPRYVDKEIAKQTSDYPLPTSADIRKADTPYLGEEYQPRSFGEKVVKTGAEFLPGMLTGEGSTIEKALTQVAFPALASEGAGELTKGTKYEPYARIAAALLAPAIGSRIVTPFRASPERTRMATMLADEGVDTTAGQRTGNKVLRAIESQTGGGAAQRVMESQGEQFTSAALSRAGIDANRATPEVLDQAFTRIGGEFDNLAANTRVNFDQQLQNDLIDAAASYAERTGESARAPLIENIMNDAAGLARSGTLDGGAYARLRTRITDGIRKADSGTQGALQDMREALDDAVERSLSPDMVDRWRTARNQYRNMLVIEKAATAAGESAREGIISPTSLRSATVSQQGRRNFARGQGDFADLARSGEGIMKPLPDSGTALNSKVRNLGTGVLSALGGGVGAMHSPEAAMAGVVAGSLIPAGVGRLAMSGPVQAYLGNQLMTARTDPRVQAIIAALLAQRQAQALPPPK